MGSIDVWVYSDAAPSSGACAAIIDDMIPDSSPPGFAGMATSCEFRNSDVGRLSFTRTPDGVFHLSSVQLNLFYSKSANLPMPYEYSPCTDVLQYLLPATAAPETGAAGGLVCAYVPPFRGQQTEEAGFWSSQPSDAPDLGPEVGCTRLLAFPKENVPGKVASCVLELPK
ncbi:MAG: hypothetical protein GEU75_11850 [Dehalococcoidia bacterium]|nr:hypothetical protein [Dehalococcoidia bacterium]